MLQRLRERLDVEACKLAPWLQEAAAECVVKASECEGPAGGAHQLGHFMRWVE